MLLPTSLSVNGDFSRTSSLRKGTNKLGLSWRGQLQHYGFNQEGVRRTTGEESPGQIHLDGAMAKEVVYIGSWTIVNGFQDRRFHSLLWEWTSPELLTEMKRNMRWIEESGSYGYHLWLCDPWYNRSYRSYYLFFPACCSFVHLH